LLEIVEVDDEVDTVEGGKRGCSARLMGERVFGFGFGRFDIDRFGGLEIGI